MAAPATPILDPALGNQVCIQCTDHAPRLDRIAASLRVLSRWAERASLAFLFLTVIALLMRPADLVPALAGFPLYQGCIALALLTSAPRFLSAPRSLRAGALLPLTALFVPAIVLSHLWNMDTWNAQIGGIEAAKAFALFFLTLAIVDTPADLRRLVLAIAVSVLVMTLLALLSYHGLVEVSALTLVVQNAAGEGDGSNIRRLCGTGIFNDPNDYALVLVLCLSVCTFALGERSLGRWRAIAVIAFGVFAYALVLTHSRGGMVSALAAAGSYVFARFGWRNAAPLILLLGLGMLAPVWGRQAHLNLADPEDTFQARLELWSASFDLFRASPIFGIGQGKLVDEIGQVTHNSFLHAFSELGLIGGTLFVGIFYLAVKGVAAARSTDTALSRLRPCILAMTVGYAAGMLALSRCYTAPVQLILGIATAYQVLASRTGPMIIQRLNTRCLMTIASISLAFLGATYLFIRLMIHRSA